MRRPIRLDNDQLSAYRPICDAIRNAAGAGLIESWQGELALCAVQIALTSGPSATADLPWRVCIERLAQVLAAAIEQLPRVLRDGGLGALASIVLENRDLLSEASASTLVKLCDVEEPANSIDHALAGTSRLVASRRVARDGVGLDVGETFKPCRQFGVRIQERSN
jgi:hypothetical protein